MPNLRGKTWTETTPAKTEDANFWESHLIDDESYEGLQDLLEGGAGGGHVIVNGAGTDMPQQPKLQFVNATVTNGNGVTIVSGNGEKGDAATVTVGTTTTGAAGTNASVTNSGTEYDAVLNFVIPRGADGEGVPDGGTTGQVLTKASNTDGDVTWTTPAGGAAWGDITGTLSNQTDLQNALDSAGKVKAVDGFNPDTATGNVTTERVLTQAEYDALSTAEKNNGMTYYISDGEGGGLAGRITLTYSDTEVTTNDIGERYLGEVNSLITAFDISETEVRCLRLHTYSTSIYGKLYDIDGNVVANHTFTVRRIYATPAFVQ